MDERRLLTQHIQESLQVTPGPFPDFWVGPGDEATDQHVVKSEIIKHMQEQLKLGPFSSTFLGLGTRSRLGVD